MWDGYRHRLIYSDVAKGGIKMKKIILEIAEFTLPEQLHLYLQDALSLPADSGQTLDEIYDFLTDIEEPMTIILPQKKL